LGAYRNLAKFRDLGLFRPKSMFMESIEFRTITKVVTILAEICNIEENLVLD